jgi:NitT/TauT family transport system permease protein
VTLAVRSKAVRPSERFTTAEPSRLKISIAQVVAILVAGVLWEYLPTIGWFSRHFRFLDRFYISSPSAVGKTIIDLMSGANNQVSVWPYLKNTLIATVIGTLIGLLLGALFGLICSSSASLAKFAGPFVVVANSVPRVALIPIVVLLVGPTVSSSTISAVLIVFFLGFFNAFAGGRNVASDVTNSARLLGASRWAVMRYVRAPHVMIWTFAAVPNAISFGLVAVVTTELLTGVNGMGSLILTSTDNLEADLSLAVVVILSVLGLALYGGAELLKRRVLRWRRSV